MNLYKFKTFSKIALLRDGRYQTLRILNFFMYVKGFLYF